MKTRIITGVIAVPLLLCVLLLAPDWATAILVGIISIIAAHEMLSASGEKIKPIIAALAMLYAAFITVATYFNWGIVAEVDKTTRQITSIGHVAMYVGMFAISAAFLMITAKSFRTGERVMPPLLYAVIGGYAIPLLLSSLITLRNAENGKLLVLLPFVSAFITDAGAYFTGVFFGKRKAFPNVSPKKTVEGCIGGIAIGIAAVIAYGAIAQAVTGVHASFLSLALCGIVGAVATEAGDLAFSLIKRERGIKDYGKLLPGHGGVLDRFDSMVLAAPAIHLVTLIILPFSA
ncbi:MAG: phosphatidate cytidylyltransferase [Oscillospiraceae bacterium]|jgi:phosphatidate cytidylyltransferase|nr:phosphatidate cytidylyltransferase [Oscillospiraceae bacterium]